MGANNQMPCDFCGAPYDPVSTRWLCPNCHMKTNCCDGVPLSVGADIQIRCQSKNN